MEVKHPAVCLPDSGRRHCLLATLAVLGSPLLTACNTPEPLLRIGSNGWPGYQFLSWAADSGVLSPQQIRLLRISSTTLAMRALSAGMLDGACLTLDEVMTSLSEGIPLKVVAVLDVSNGADAVLGGDSVTSLAQLAGKRIGVEGNAVGAVMLDALLQRAGLQHDQVMVVPLLLDQHEAAFERGDVDVLVTMEPQASRLRARGASELFSSADIPGRIVDVLAVHEQVLGRSRRAVQALVDGHFAMLQRYSREEQAGKAYMASQLGVSHAELQTIFAGMHLPGRAENQRWLTGRLDQEARNLTSVMRRAGLLPRPVTQGQLSVPDFVEGA
ncbi:MAG: ABC transporter substrate-binding protein [Vogesella sp.]|uniref:ABC transporter substrate-binding protein n=1 Tax=Vogesella sp. TaxID=1904252 RepID=UPI00391D7D36